MRGRIRKRGARYEVFLDVGEQDAQRCPACRKRYWLDGGRLGSCERCGGDLEVVKARRERWAGSFERQKEAEGKLAEAMVVHQQGDYVQADRITVGEYLREWIESIEEQVRPSTHLSYRGHCQQHIIPKLGHIRLQQLSGLAIEAFYGDLRTTGGRKGDRLSVMSRRHIHATLRRALNDATRKRLITRNPALDVDPPRVERDQAPTLQTWSGEDLRAFLGSARDGRMGVLWHVMAMTGLRRGEAAAVRWGVVDLEAGTLRVERNRVAVGYRDVIEGAPKSAKGKRTIPLDPTTTAALRAWKKRQTAERLQWGPAWTDSGYVFTREDGKPWHPDRISKLFDKAVKAADVPRIRLHDLRHTFATLLFAANEHPKTVQELLGHSTISVTLDTYTHARPETLASATAHLGAIVEGRG